MELHSQFLLQNAHFALNIISSLSFFAISWLYFDAWFVRRGLKASLKWVGFFFVSISFLTHSIYIEQTILVNPLLGADTIELLNTLLRTIGYAIIVMSLVTDHIQKRPKSKYVIFPAVPIVAIFLSVHPVTMLHFLNAILITVIAFLYLRRATIGLESHLKLVTSAFYLLAGFEVFSLGLLFGTSSNIALGQFTSAFGPAWIMVHLFQLVSVVIFARWVFGYLVKRIQTQLFMFVTTGIIAIFLITTIAFTFLLLRNIEQLQLEHLTSDVGALRYALQSKRQETLADAQLIAGNQDIALTLLDEDRGALRDISTTILLAKKESNLIIIDENSIVRMRAEDPDRFGDSLSSELIVKRALQKEASTTVAMHENVLAPIVSIRSAAPIVVEDQIIGVVIVGSVIDNAFVDGVKDATGLDTAIYAGNIRSATTYLAPDGKSRWIGVRESNSKVTEAVLKKRQVYSGALTILNTPYLASFAPLEDGDHNSIGMLFVGKKYTEILQTAGKSIELTFLVSTVLLIFSIFPAYFIARNITKQLS